APGEDVRMAAAAAATLAGMANDLLDVSRLEEGRMPLQRRACDLVDLARQVVAGVAGLDRQRSLEVEAEGPLAVEADPALIRRVLENLLTNAVKHTPEGGRLRVALARSGEGARVEVQDE